MELHFDDYLLQVPLLSFIWILLCAVPMVASIIAIIRIIQRAGYSGWWILISLVPMLNLFALWYFGFGPWPSLDSKAVSSN